jgi:hypothetical protein
MGLFDSDLQLQARVQLVWKKALIIPGYEHLQAMVRWDVYHSVIQFQGYGDRDHEFGWEFDHWPMPKWMGGSDDISNLRPLHWRNNCDQGPFGGLGGLYRR